MTSEAPATPDGVNPLPDGVQATPDGVNPTAVASPAAGPAAGSRCLARGYRGRRVAHQGGRAPDLGMATAEYAIATLAACGFAGMLLALMRSDEVRTLLSGVIRRALSLT